MHSGWEPEVQRVRLALPAHLHDFAPYPNGGRGLWAVIATLEDVPIGLAWSIQSVVDPQTALVEEVAVLQEWRRQGVGRRLLIESAGWMAEKGYLRLSSHPITPEAHQLLERLGFVADGYGGQQADITELLAMQ